MNDDLTTRLSRQLHEQADDWHGAPLTLEGVRGRARSIRRRRAAVGAGVAAAAVMAVILPVTLALDGSPDSQRPDVTVTPTEAVDPTPRADGTFPLTIDVPEGALPETGYIAIDDDRLVTPDGRFDLPGDFRQVAPYDGGWVGIRAGDLPPTGHQVVVMDQDFQEISATSSGGGLAISADGDRVAWVEVDPQNWTLVNAPVDGGEPIRTPVSEESIPVGFLADDAVAFSWTDPAAGQVNGGVAYPDGAYDDPALDGLQRLTGVAAGRVAVQTEFRGDSSCSEVRDQAGRGETVWDTCDYQLRAFSPDGQLVIGYASYFDLGSPTLSILDAATGDPVVEFASGNTAPSATVVHAAVWEDDDTVIAHVEQGGDQTLVRLELNGGLTRVAEIRQPRDLSLEFFLPQHVGGL